MTTKAYYNKWEKFAKEEVEKTEAEEEKEKEEANASLGLNTDAPASEAEKLDKLKRKELKETKKLWQDKKKDLESKKFYVKGKEGETVLLEPKDLGSKNVLLFDGNKNCTFELSSSLKLVKCLVNGCENCNFVFHCDTLTSYVELSHCVNCVFDFYVIPKTLQVDLSEKVCAKYLYRDSVLPGNPGWKIFSAANKALNVQIYKGANDSLIEETVLDYEELGEKYSVTSPKGQQYLVQFKDGKLVTEFVVRKTMSSHYESMPMVSKTGEKLAPPKLDMEHAKAEKTKGNVAFKDRNYAQACMHYTQALRLSAEPQSADEYVNSFDSSVNSGENSTFMAVCFSNRAACLLKLGDMEKALHDASSCVKLDPKNVKGLFRKGLALHGLKRHGEASVSLANALDLEPKNNQIKQALGFAKMAAAKQHSY